MLCSRLEWVAGVCLINLVSQSSGVKEASVVLWNPPNHHCSILASETLVSGASGRSRGFSSRVARQASLARRSSSRVGYQAKWSVYWQWCRDEGHSISRPSLPKVHSFLFWLRRSRKLSVSAVMGYRLMLSAVFSFSTSQDLFFACDS